MNFFDRIQTFIDHQEERRLYHYLIGLSGVITLLIFGLLFYYYKRAHSLQDSIETTNEQRNRIRNLVGKYEQVKKQRAAVDMTLSEDKGFKLGGYFNTLLTTHNLADKKVSVDHAYSDPTNNYRESILKAKLTGMNMKELCELLNDIASNPRVYTKELEITQSKKIPQTIDVTLSIATLEPKVAQPE